MKQLDLSHITPLETIVEFSVDDQSIDLHNCFDCTKIDTDPFNRTVVLHFESTNAYFLLCFFSATPYQVKYEGFSYTNEKGLSIDRLTRIVAAESREGEWIDLPKNKRYYEVSFTEGFEMVIEAGKVLLIEGDFTLLQHKRSLEKQLASLAAQLEDLHKQVASLDNPDQQETKRFLQKRKLQRESIIGLEQEQARKQNELTSIIKQEQELLIKAVGKTPEHIREN